MLEPDAQGKIPAKTLRGGKDTRGGGGAGITGPHGGGNIGNVPHRYSDEIANKVKMLTALGNNQEAIAFAVDMSVDTLTKYYRRELDLGKLEIKSKLGAAILSTAMGEDVQCVACEGKTKVDGRPCRDCHGKGRVWVREPNPTAQVWASKNLMGWTDAQRIEHSGPDGGPIVHEQRSSQRTVNERLQAIRERQAQALPKPEAE